MTAFGKSFKAISLKHQPAHVKFIYNQLPPGDQQYQQSPVKDTNRKYCQTCKSQEETIPSFLHCHQIPNQSKSKKTMSNTIMKDSHPSRSTFVSCIEQHLQHPGQQIQCINHQSLSQLNHALHMAIENKHKSVGTKMFWDTC